jgi:hypothetical protein
VCHGERLKDLVFCRFGCFGGSIKTTLGFPLGIPTLQNADVVVTGNTECKTALGRDATRVAVDDHWFIFGDLVALVEYLTPFNFRFEIHILHFQRSSGTGRSKAMMNKGEQRLQKKICLQCNHTVSQIKGRCASKPKW